MTAVLEVENKESLTKLLKMAKIAGIYAKQRRVNPVLTARRISEAEKRRSTGNGAIALFREIRQGVIDAGETMTMDEINAEIAEYRREKRMQKCLA